MGVNGSGLVSREVRRVRRGLQAPSPHTGRPCHLVFCDWLGDAALARPHGCERPGHALSSPEYLSVPRCRMGTLLKRRPDHLHFGEQQPSPSFRQELTTFYPGCGQNLYSQSVQFPSVPATFPFQSFPPDEHFSAANPGPQLHKPSGAGVGRGKGPEWTPHLLRHYRKWNVLGRLSVI